MDSDGVASEMGTLKIGGRQSGIRRLGLKLSLFGGPRHFWFKLSGQALSDNPFLLIKTWRSLVKGGQA